MVGEIEEIIEGLAVNHALGRLREGRAFRQSRQSSGDGVANRGKKTDLAGVLLRGGLKGARTFA